MADYVLEGPRWAGRSITWSYALSTYAEDASSPLSAPIGDAYKGQVQAAFDTWAAAGGLRFILVADSPASAGSADIRVGFGVFPGNQIGQTTYRSLAGAFVPGIIVQLQDPAVTPLVPSGTGELRYAPFVSEFRQVLTHELGHALGLGHAGDPRSVMAATATAANRALSLGDVAGIQALYAPARLSAPASFAVALTHGQASLAPGGDGRLRVSGPGITQAALAPGVYRVGFLDGAAVFDGTDATGIVTRLYQAAFGRVGDAAGVAHWTQALRDGTSVLGVARAFAASDEMAARALPDAGFVAAVYRDGLGRAPEPDGLRSHVQALAGGAERAQVLLGISESAEAKAHLMARAGDAATATAYRLYETVLDRAPDAGGLAYSGGLIARGVTAADLAQSMLASPEFAGRYGGLTDRDYAAALYRNGLNRDADAGGLAWAQGLLTQGMSRAGLAAAFADSAEARGLTAAATHDGWAWLG